MFNKNKIMQLVGRYLHGPGIAAYDKRITHPIREWLVGLALFTAVIVVGSVFSAHDFLQYQNISTSGGTFQGTATVFNQAQVQKALDAYKKKDDAYTQLQQTMSVTPYITASSSSTLTATTTPTNTAATTTTTAAATTTMPSPQSTESSSSDAVSAGPPVLEH